MDEPLSNLDAKLRVQMRSEIVKLHKRINATTIYVTHDQTEAMTMADRIVVMKNGFIQQIGTPKEIYDYPANKFVATFIGTPSMNVIKARFDNDKLYLDSKVVLDLDKNRIEKIRNYYKNTSFDISTKLAQLNEELNKLNLLKKPHEKEEKRLNELDKEISYLKYQDENFKLAKENKPFDIYFGIRPEDIHHFIDANKEYTKSKTFDFVVKFKELLGNEYFLHLGLEDKELNAKIPANDKLIKENDVLPFHFDLDKMHLFDISSETIIF